MLMGESVCFNDSLSLLDFAHENGVTLFDTAEMYPVRQSAKTQGQSESFLGKWMKSQQRDRIVVSTKVTGPSGKMTWIRDGPRALDRGNIKEALEGSLRRLQTDYIDIYHLHWPDRYVPVFGKTEYDPRLAIQYIPFEEQYEALMECVREGKVRRLGVSNESPFGLMRFCQLANGNSESPKIHCIQNAYHLLNRTFDSGLAECCHQENVSLHAYSVLAMGLLTGKYMDGVDPQSRFVFYEGKYPEIDFRYRSKPNIDPAIAEYASLAQSAGISLTEMALRFVMHHPLVETAIFGATSLDQLKQNLAAMESPPLEEALLNQINEIHLGRPNPAP